MSHAPTLADIRTARAQMRDAIVLTPSKRAPRLEAHVGDARIALKLETFQRTGSFKDRGAFVKLSSLTDAQRSGGIIAASAGNHAQGVAFHGARLGIATTIVMPRTTPFTKVRRTTELGARVVLAGETMAETFVHAEALRKSEHLTEIHPFADPAVIAGQGTIALELAEQVPDADTLVIPVGGGGLIAGMAIAAKALNPTIRIVAVQTEHYASLRGDVELSKRETQSIAEGIAVKHIGELNRTIIDRYVDDVIFVAEESIERAIHLFLEEEKIVAEGAGAVAYAAMLQSPERFAGRNCALVVSGGNIDTGLLSSVITRVRLHEGRVVRMRVEIVDAPGALVQVASAIAERGANILDVAHQRGFKDVPAKCAELDLTIEMRRPEDTDEIVNALCVAGFPSVILDSRGFAVA
jgi:threonine dehydratase